MNYDQRMLQEDSKNAKQISLYSIFGDFFMIMRLLEDMIFK